MRMKDVCERTGLTDRAVRLYIESGLVTPKEQLNYTGRRTILFDESDVRTLEAVATLRRADFSISDISEMQSDPDRITDVVNRHRAAMAEDIKNKQAILLSLDSFDRSDIEDYFGVAEVIRNSASRNTIPKEDSGMSLKDIKSIVAKRILVIISWLCLAVGLVNLGVLVVKTTFSRAKMFYGGGYELEYYFDIHDLKKNALVLIAVAVLVFAVAASSVYLFGGKKKWLIISAALSVAVVGILLLLPSYTVEKMYYHEFIAFRAMFIDTPLFSPGADRETLIKSLKYIPVVAGAVLAFWGYLSGDRSDSGE